MTTNTYIGNGIYMTSATAGIISHCDVGITNTDSPYTALFYDKVIRANATSGNITINLPTAVGKAEKEYHIFRTDIIASTNIITIDASGSQTIDGNLTYILFPGEYVRLESDGANWQVIGRPTPTPYGYYFPKGATYDRRIIAGANNNAIAFAVSTTSPALNTLWAFSFVISRTTLFDTGSIVVGTASTTGNSRIGIYRDNGNNYPGARLWDSGAIVTSSIGTKNVTITPNIILQPGLYWGVYEQDTATGQYRILPPTYAVLSIMGVDNSHGAGNATQGYYYSVAHTFGALPDPYTAGATLGNIASAGGTPLVTVGFRPM